MLKSFASLLLISNFLLVIQSCGGSRQGEKLTKLRYGYSISIETASAVAERTDLLAAYIQKKTGLPLEPYKTAGYEPMIEAMCAGKVDLAAMGPFAYVIASSKGCGEVIATRGTDSGQPSSYDSIIAVNEDSPIKTLADLKAHAHELTFAFTDPASTSGHLVPRAGLVAAGIDPERDFKKVMFGMGEMAHMQTALMLKSGKVDSAAMMQRIVDVLVARGKLKPGEIRPLWVSAPIPSDPVVVRKSLPAELKKKIRDAFVNMATDDPKLLQAMTVAHVTTGTRYVAVPDSLFDPLRKMAHDTPELHMGSK